MPSSRFANIPRILELIRLLEPASLLDVGAGFGKWGFLFREYTDIWASADDPNRYHRSHWRVRIDAIEGFETYITPVHQYIYNNVFVGDMRQLAPGLGNYDIIMLGDIIEHVTLDEGAALLAEVQRHATKAVVVSTPATFVEQGAACGNPLETHRSFWDRAAFRSVGPCVTFHGDDDVLLAVYFKPGVDPRAVESALALDALKPPGGNLSTTLKNAAALGLRSARALTRNVSRAVRSVRTAFPRRFAGTGNYWDRRYKSGDGSGLGSRGHLAQYKARVLNEFISAHHVSSLIDFGSGDGELLSLLSVPAYTGVDISKCAVDGLRKRFSGDRTKTFLELTEIECLGSKKPVADMTISLDVIYHLIEDDLFERHMQALFDCAARFVAIYSSNVDARADQHVRHRHFTRYIDSHFPDWRLARSIKNEYPSDSHADFYIYSHRTQEVSPNPHADNAT